MTRAWMAAAVALPLIATAGCSSCDRSRESIDAARPATLEIAPGTPVRPWVLQQPPTPGVALPVPCRMTRHPLLHPSEGQSLLFAAADGELRTLAVAAIDPSSGVPSARGIVDTSAPDAGATNRDVPWLDARTPPVLAASKGRWLAVVSQHDPFSPNVHLWLWREGLPIAPLAEGDRLTPLDARCVGEECAVLTTRAGAVASAGATLWLGAWGDGLEKWKRLEVAGGAVPQDAQAVAMARFDGASEAVVAFDSPEGILFVRVHGDAVSAAGRVERDDGLLDVSAAGALPVVVSVRGRPEAGGCKATASLVVRAPEREPIVLPLTTFPSAGYARSVADGVIVAWPQPVDCITERRVLHAIALDSGARPAGSVVSVAEADGFALASAGEEIRIWLRESAGVRQVDGRCALGARP